MPGSSTPALFPRLLRSSTAPSESSPASIRGSSDPTAPPRTAPTASSTCARRASFCSSDAPAAALLTALPFRLFTLWMHTGRTVSRDCCAALPASASENCANSPGSTALLMKVDHTNGLTTATCSVCTLVAACADDCMNTATTSSPTSGITTPSPPRSARAMVLASRSAMPPPDHVPHCALPPTRPHACRIMAAPSSAAFAAV